MNCVPRALACEVRQLVSAAVRAADPAVAIRAHLSWTAPGTLCIGGTPVDVFGGSVLVLALGKAAVPMAAEALRILRSNAACPAVRGAVVTKRGGVPDGATPDALGLAGCEVIEAAHPQPDETSVAAGLCLLELARGAGAGAMVLVLLSGGASSLTLTPRAGLSLADLQAVNAALLGCGAPIREINALRKHLSRVGGGQLGAAAIAGGAARVVTLVLSDVTGDVLDVIGSGPTVPDSTTWATCLDVVGRYGGLRAAMPRAALALLEAGAAGREPETPSAARPGDIALVVGSNALSAAAAAAAAADLGYHTVRLGSALEGEAREVAKVVVALLAGARGGRTQSDLAAASSHARGVCLLLGGETTVTLGAAPPGSGGRNQELALAAALQLDAAMGSRESRGPRCAVLSFGTDGGDGPTDAAGAVVTELTVRAAAAAGLDAGGALTRHDSHTFFRELGDASRVPAGAAVPVAAGDNVEVGAGGLVRTGQTGTNVCDVVAALYAAEGWEVE